MKKFIVILLCLFFTSMLLANNTPEESFVPWSLNKDLKPNWKTLDKMNIADKENAIIEFEVGNEVSAEAKEAIDLIEDKWNSGNYEEANDILRNFEELWFEPFGIQWKEHIIGSAKWGDDVQIGTQDDIYHVVLDVDNSTGYLFSALLYYDEGDSRYEWEVYISLDTGKTWSNTYTWYATTNIPDIDGVVVGSHFYVGYSYKGDSTSGRLRRFFTSDGTSDVSYDWFEVFDEGIEILERALSCNVDQYNNRVYYSALLADYSIKFYWDDLTATSWTPSHPTIGNAERGLDLCWNYLFSTYAEYCSYVGTSDSLYVLGWNGYSWSNFGNLDYVGMNSIAKTSIAAYGDTIMSTFPHYVSPYYNFRYRVSYNGGTNWTFGTIASPSENIGLMNDITGRMGDGFGVVYQNEGLAAEGFYRHRTYHYTVWTPQVSFADSVTRYNVKPAIERVANGVYGIIYANYPHEYAYFDRSDWISGIDEETPDLDGKIAKLIGNSPNPFNQNTNIRYLLANGERVSLKIYDVSGKLIKTLVEGYRGPGEHSITWFGRNNNGNYVPSGIYFAKLSVGNFSDSKKIVMIK